MAAIVSTIPSLDFEMEYQEPVPVGRQKQKQMSNNIWLEAFVKFIKISWDEVQDGDVIYYQILRRHQDDNAHGPFIVVDKTRNRLRNGNGVELNFNFDNLQLLKFDLVSILMGD